MTYILKRNLLYKKIFIEHSLLITPENSNHIRWLVKEKMVNIRKDYAYLDPFCSEPTYEKQLINNERRYKTLVSLLTYIEHGERRILHRLFLAFHEPVPYAKRMFFAAYPGFEEDEKYTIIVQYTDSYLRKVNTVYESGEK
jgi:hypothetical protein